MHAFSLAKRVFFSSSVSLATLILSGCGAASSVPPCVQGEQHVAEAPAPKRDPRVSALPPFQEHEAALIAQCKHTPEDGSNIAQKEAAAKDVRCLQEVVRRDAATKPLRDFHAALEGYVEDVCWLSEEAAWMDLSDGTRSDGTLRSYTWLGCQLEGTLELSYLYRGMTKKDWPTLDAHMAVSARRGHQQAKLLESHRKKANDLAASPLPESSTFGTITKFGARDAREYATRIGRISKDTETFAARLCEAFPTLASEGCVEKATTYLFSLGVYAGNFADR